MDAASTAIEPKVVTDVKCEVGACCSSPGDPPPAKKQCVRWEKQWEKLLECPVCMETMHPPIYQCTRGHTVCNKCSTKLSTCPKCRDPFSGNIRCLALEQAAAELGEVPCRFQSHGCTMSPQYSAKLAHEESCKHRPFHCIKRGCVWTGSLSDLITHLQTHPKIDVKHSSEISSNFAICESTGVYNPMVYKVLGTHHFCLLVEAIKLEGPLCYVAWIQFMGEPLDARGFRYSLEVQGKGRKISWEGVPRSIREPENAVRDSHDCLIVRKNVVDFFSVRAPNDDRAVLNISGKIWRVGT